MPMIHVFLNFAAPFVLFFSILLFPPLLLYKLLSYIYRCTFPENMAGKVVLLTGASSGIGEYVAYEYAKREACLVLCARRESKLQKVAQAALELGSPDVVTVRADVSKHDDCKRIVDKAINHFGKLDHLVNNAGITSVCEFQSWGDPTYFRHIMDTNFWGSVYTIHCAIGHLKKSNGKIVVISSAASWFPFPGMTIYNASKAALTGLYETLKVELGSSVGITIVTPGFIESEITRGKHFTEEGEQTIDPRLVNDVLGSFPVGKVEDCASAIVKSAIRGDKYLTEPPWTLVTFYWMTLLPDLMEWIGCGIMRVAYSGSFFNISKRSQHRSQ